MTPTFKRVLPFLVAFSLMLLLAPAMANEQNHECQGGNNCNEGGGDGGTTVDVDINGRVSGGDATSIAGALATGGDATAGGGDAASTADATSDSDASVSVENSLIRIDGGNGDSGSGDGDVDANTSGSPLAGTNFLSPSTSVTTTTTNKYKEAPRAYAGTASSPKDIDCRTILGFDFRGATEDGAGGATFGVPLGERKDCKYERQAARAFAKGDLERGWANHCMSPTNIEVTTMVARVVYSEQLDTDGAFKRCMETALLPSLEVAGLEGKSRP